MPHNTDEQIIQIEAVIEQLLSGLPKTYVPFKDAEIWENLHLEFAQKLEDISCQEYALNVRAAKLIRRFDWQWLEVENLGKYRCFPNILVC